MVVRSGEANRGIAILVCGQGPITHVLLIIRFIEYADDERMAMQDFPSVQVIGETPINLLVTASQNAHLER